MRELFEETGIVAKPACILDVHDAITRDADGRVQFHYLLIAVRGIWQSGEGEPADDAAACAWVTRDEIVAGRYPTFPTLLPLLDRAMKPPDCAGTGMPPQRRDGGGAAE